MQTEFIQLTLSKDEAARVLEALAASFVVEDEIRAQQGLEAVPLPQHLARLAGLLRISDEALKKLMDLTAEGLWEYSWFVYTSEWAWFRAQHDALRQMHAKHSGVTLDHPDCRRRAEILYRKNFEKYVREIDMRNAPTGPKSQIKSGKRKSGEV